MILKATGALLRLVIQEFINIINLLLCLKQDSFRIKHRQGCASK